MDDYESLSNEGLLLARPGPRHRIGETLKELWEHRELLYFLVWKDIKVKYKQTSLGVIWAVLQPLLGMVLFTLLFGKVAKLPSDDLPYPVFYYAALLLWTYFSTTLTMASNSVVNNANVITKVYFPRILLPAANVCSGLLDLAIASVLLFVLLTFYEVSMTLRLLVLPYVMATLVIFTLGTGILFAALTVNYRDIRYALPFAIQVWLFASPVVYPTSMVPEHYQWVILLNPLAGIIETTRAVIAGRSFPWEAFVMSSITSVLVLVVGLWYFRRTERRFADVI